MALFFPFFPLPNHGVTSMYISEFKSELLNFWRNTYFCHLLCAAVHVSPILCTNNPTWYPLCLELLTSLKLLIFIASFKNLFPFIDLYYFLTFEMLLPSAEEFPNDPNWRKISSFFVVFVLFGVFKFLFVCLFQWCRNIYCLHFHFSLWHIILAAITKIPPKTWKFCLGTTDWERFCVRSEWNETHSQGHAPLHLLKLWTKPSCCQDATATFSLGYVQEQTNTWSYLFSIAICCFLHFIKKSSRSFKVLNMKQKATEVSKLIQSL